MNFYPRFEVKVLRDYLRLINDPHSDEGDEALEMVINVPNRYVGRKFVSDLGEYCARKEVHLYQGLKSMRIELPYLRKNLKTFTTLIDSLIEEAKQIQPVELIQILRETLDYDHFIMEDELPSPDDSKIANINQLQMVASRYRDIKSLLNYTDTFQEASSEGKEHGVSLMTIHKSKGLEFPVVFLVGLVEGILPTRRGDSEEERRICFVGISRAMKLLYLSHSRTYMGQPAQKSIFLDEMLGTKK
jgi:DNA helicase-2/ATP-dependent DNA helicase PcrA